MELSPDIATPEPILVNLGELARQLGTSRKSLATWLERWPDFPIVERGTNGREYSFDAAAVFDFLRAKRQENAASTAARDQALSQLTLPFDLDGDEGPQTPGLSIKDQIEAMKLRRIQREEAQASGQLVEAAKISNVLIQCFQQLNRALRAAVRQAARDHKLPDSVMRSIDICIADAQRDFVRNAANFIKQPADDLDVDPGAP